MSGINSELILIIESIVETGFSSVRHPICKSISWNKKDYLPSPCHMISCKNCICWAYKGGKKYTNKIIDTYLRIL
ncbi:hypothetical protein PJM42_0013 [Salmonella phage vB_SenP_UTK0001]|nr:hypothetical protein PJM42_0013 [Salmonella phage vB_SenP_UTK0001]